MCSSYIFFTSKRYLKCTTSLLSPTSAISMCPTFKVYIHYNASQVNFHQVQEWNQIFTAPRYICPIMAVQIFWPTARKPLSNLRAQIGGPGGSQIDLTWSRIWTFWEQKCGNGKIVRFTKRQLGWWGFKEDVRILVNFRIAHLIKCQKLLVKYENKIVSNPLGISNVLKSKWWTMMLRVC